VYETALGKKAALKRHGLGFVALSLLAQAIEREYVLDTGLLLEPQKDVVAKQQAVADLSDISCRAVVLGTDADPPHHLHLAAAKGLQARFVQALGDVPKT